MERTQKRILTLAVLITVGTLAVSYPQRDRRIQTRVYDNLARAEFALNAGEFQTAEVYAGLVLMKDEIKVHLNVNRCSEERKQAAEAAFSEAAKMWEEALGGEVAFVLVSNHEADLKVGYRPKVKVYGEEVAGHATWSREVQTVGASAFGYKVRGEIMLRTQDRDGKDLSHEAMMNTAAHELGHILGLEDSPRDGDIMSTLRIERPITRPSADELGRLREVRASARSVSDSALNASVRNW